MIESQGRSNVATELMIYHMNVCVHIYMYMYIDSPLFLIPHIYLFCSLFPCLTPVLPFPSLLSILSQTLSSFTWSVLCPSPANLWFIPASLCRTHKHLKIFLSLSSFTWSVLCPSPPSPVNLQSNPSPASLCHIKFLPPPLSSHFSFHCTHPHPLSSFSPISLLTSLWHLSLASFPGSPFSCLRVYMHLWINAFDFSHAVTLYLHVCVM